MRKPSTKTLTILCDNRERQPLLFPGFIEYWFGQNQTVRFKVKEKVTRLEAGDYMIEDYFGAGIERKNGVSEIFANLSTGKVHDQLGRFSEAFTVPYLMIEGNVTAFREKVRTYRDGHPTTADGREAFCVITQMAATHGIRPMWVGAADSPSTRRLLGGNMIRLLLSHKFKEEGYVQ